MLCSREASKTDPTEKGQTACPSRRSAQQTVHPSDGPSVIRCCARADKMDARTVPPPVLTSSPCSPVPETGDRQTLCEERFPWSRMTKVPRKQPPLRCVCEIPTPIDSVGKRLPQAILTHYCPAGNNLSLSLANILCGPGQPECRCLRLAPTQTIVGT